MTCLLFYSLYVCRILLSSLKVLHCQKHFTMQLPLSSQSFMFYFAWQIIPFKGAPWKSSCTDVSNEKSPYANVFVKLSRNVK